MTQRGEPRPFRRLLPAALATVASGCGGGSEDVRIALCKDMAEILAGSAQAVAWQGVETRMEGYEGLTVTVRFEAVDGAGRAAERVAQCHYDYDDTADEYGTSSDPISIYATNPRRVTLDGRPITGRPLTELVHQAMGRQAQDWLSRLSGVIDRLFGRQRSAE